MASAEGVNGVQANSDGRVGDRQIMKERERGEGGERKKKIKIKRERKRERARERRSTRRDRKAIWPRATSE